MDRGPHPPFQAAADGLSATWIWSAPLPSDGYALRLSDRVTDLSGNRLDGEGNGTAGLSGNGIPGGDLRTPFDLVAGDADLSGTTDASDLADTLGAPAEVQAEVRAHLGDRASPLPPDTTLLVAGLGDSDGDGTDEVATLQESPTPRIRVQAADDVVPERDITLGAGYHWLAPRPRGAPAARRRRSQRSASTSAAGATGSPCGTARRRRRGPGARTRGDPARPGGLAGRRRQRRPRGAGRSPYSDTARLRVLRTANGTSSVTTVGGGVEATRILWSPATGAAGPELTLPVRRRSSGTSRVYRFDADTLARLTSFAVGAGAITDASVSATR